MFSSVNRAAVVSDLSPARRWHIVLARDRRFDGEFVYAVRSTGIYCRPTCPSRRPRRELVTFFPIPEAAEQAGFRPCQRCRPATYAAGYGSSSRVYERAGAHLGMTPATYARGGRGARIAFTVVPCPHGSLLVAATERGICRIGLGAGAEELAAGLRAEFPAAQIRGDRGPLRRWVGAILRHLEGRAPHLDLPLDGRATAFQRAVWEALRKIPYGSTRSYAEIAHAIGRPRATRAVARACATNPAAIVIPCHRVVRQDGDLGGYRWGIRRKRALIEGERATKANS